MQLAPLCFAEDLDAMRAQMEARAVSRRVERFDRRGTEPFELFNGFELASIQPRTSPDKFARSSLPGLRGSQGVHLVAGSDVGGEKGDHKSRGPRARRKDNRNL